MMYSKLKNIDTVTEGQPLSIIEWLLIITGTFWLIIVLGVPRAYTNLKIVFLFIICLLALVDYGINNIEISVRHFGLTLLFICYYMVSLLFGIMWGYKFDLSVDKSLLQYFVITPLASLILGMLFYDKKRYNYIKYGFVIFAAAISLSDVLAILNLMGAFPHLLIFDYMFVANTRSDNSAMVMRMSSDPALIFLIPYSICLLPEITKIKNVFIKICDYVAVIFGITYAIISGRKILEIVILLSIAVMIFYTFKQKSLRIKFKIFLLIVLSLLFIIYFGEKLSSIFHVDSIFESAFKYISHGLSGSASGVISRENNIKALMNMWLTDFGTFLFGNGLNSYAPTSLANDVTFWSYEVFYNALLAQTGIIGVAILGYVMYCFCKITYNNYKLTGEVHHFAFLIGTLCFIFASSSNPMLYNVWFWAFLWAEKYYHDKVVVPETQNIKEV